MTRWILLWLALLCSPAIAGMNLHGSGIPVADVVCTITTGNCTGTGGGSSLFTAATCNGDGVTDDAAAFRSFNAWATGTWQASHTGLVQLTIPAGKVCQFISGTGSSNGWMQGVLRSQTVGYGATVNDNGGTGAGYILGCGPCGVQFNGTDSTVRLATVTAGSSSITLLDTAKCSLFANGDTFLITGIDTQGFGDPPNPDRFEWPVIASTAACAGSGVITLTAPLTYTYKSTWPLYNAGRPGLNSDNGGPATAYQLYGTWNSIHAYYGLNFDQGGTHTAGGAKDITYVDVSCPGIFCIIPSQNQTFRVTNLSAPNNRSEMDKIVGTAIFTNVTMFRMFVQSSEVTNWTCTNCTFGAGGVAGTTRNTTFINSNIPDLSLGAVCCGASGSFTATNTVISGLSTSGASLDNINTRGVWASGTLTVPTGMHVTSAADNGSGLIRWLVDSTAGWTTGVGVDGPGGNCSGYFILTVIDATHVDLQGSTFTGTCSGGVGSLPLTMMVPGANIFFNAGSHGSPSGPMLQVADLAVGPNNETIVSFNQNGSPYAGGFPTMAAGAARVIVHPAPSFSCTGCTGALNVTDVNGLPTGPFGSQATRVVTAANSGSAISLPAFGLFSELDMLVTAPCGGASDIGLEQGAFTAILGSASFGIINPTANAAISSGTPRVVTPTGATGAQSGDTLTPPGANTIILTGQSLPFYSNVGNCANASTTFTIKTNQGVVYP